MSSADVRLATLADLPQVAALFDAYRQFYEQPADLAAATRFIRDRLQNSDAVILVVETTGPQGHAVIGLCQLYPGLCSLLGKPIYTLHDLFVTPEERSCGVGRTLLLAAHLHAASNGIARLDLSTARSNLAAQALYESLGWERDDAFISYCLQV